MRLQASEELTAALLAAWTVREGAHRDCFANAYSPGADMADMRRKFVTQLAKADQAVLDILARIVEEHRVNVGESKHGAKGHVGVTPKCQRCGANLYYGAHVIGQAPQGFLPNNNQGKQIFEKTGMCYDCFSKQTNKRSGKGPLPGVQWP